MWEGLSHSRSICVTLATCWCLFYCPHGPIPSPALVPGFVAFRPVGLTHFACLATCATCQVVVEGQANAVPMSSVAAPTLTSAGFGTPGVTLASTSGGTVLVVNGSNFGHIVGYTSVTIRVPAGDLGG